MYSPWRTIVFVLDHVIIGGILLYFLTHRSLLGNHSERVEPLAHVVKCTGGVQLKAAQDKPWNKVHAGIPLYSHEVLRTGLADSATLQLAQDGSFVEVAPGQEIEIDENLGIPRRSAPVTAPRKVVPAQSKVPPVAKGPSVPVRPVSKEAVSRPIRQVKIAQASQKRAPKAGHEHLPKLALRKPHPPKPEPQVRATASVPAPPKPEPQESATASVPPDVPEPAPVPAETTDAATLEGYRSMPLMTGPIGLRSPELAADIEQKPEGTPFRFSWDTDPIAMAKGFSYFFEISVDPSFTTGLLTRQTREPGLSSKHLPLRSGTYFWRVSIVDKDGQLFRQSDTWTFSFHKR